jgi:hypothetical protein
LIFLDFFPFSRRCSSCPCQAQRHMSDATRFLRSTHRPSLRPADGGDDDRCTSSS